MIRAERHVERWPRAVMAMVLAALVLVGCGGDEGSSAGFSRDDIVSMMSGEGFSGEESPLTDGTPRWLGRGPDASILEIVGPPDEPTAVSLTVAASGESGELTGKFLDTWAPGSRDFLSSVLKDAQENATQDQQREFGERTVRVQTLPASDGALVVTTIYE